MRNTLCESDVEALSDEVLSKVWAASCPGEIPIVGAPFAGEAAAEERAAWSCGRLGHAGSYVAAEWEMRAGQTDSHGKTKDRKPSERFTNAHR